MLYLYFILILVLILGILLWPVRAQKQLCAIISVVFIVSAFGIYALVGTPQIVPLMAAHDEKMATLKTSILAHSEAVKINPKDISAWLLLGGDFMEAGQYGKAANAFKQAVLLSNGDPIAILAYAEAMIFEAEGKVSDSAKKSLDMVLLQDAKNSQARYYSAVYELQQGNTEKAMKMMKALYHSLPDDSPLKVAIDRQIGR